MSIEIITIKSLFELWDSEPLYETTIEEDNLSKNLSKALKDFLDETAPDRISGSSRSIELGKILDNWLTEKIVFKSSSFPKATWQLNKLIEHIKIRLRKFPKRDLSISADSDELSDIQFIPTLLLAEHLALIKIRDVTRPSIENDKLKGCWGFVVDVLSTDISQFLDKEDKVVTYFDLEFDFKNNGLSNSQDTQKTSLQIKDSSGNQTNFYPFKILLENKGEWLSKKDIEERGFIFPEQGSVTDCSSLDSYLRKSIHSKFKISNHEIFKNPRSWLKYDIEGKKIMLVSDA